MSTSTYIIRRICLFICCISRYIEYRSILDCRHIQLCYNHISILLVNKHAGNRISSFNMGAYNMFCYMHVPMLSTLFINVYTLPTILGKVSFSYMIRVKIEARLLGMYLDGVFLQCVEKTI